MSNNNLMLTLCELTKQFGGIVAVDDVNIEVSEGDIFGVIGPNGAGKTTIFNLITGIYAPTKGKIILDGEDITNQETHIIAKKGIARTFQNIRLFDNLTVYNNILIACHGQAKYGLISGFFKTKKCKEEEEKLKEKVEYALKSVDLIESKEMYANNLPYGEQRRLEIARALATNPKILLLDEPAAGMNENESKQLVGFLKKIKDDYNLTIIIIDHHMDVIMDACNKIAVLNFGKKIATGTPDEIQNNPIVIEAYLGVDE